MAPDAVPDFLRRSLGLTRARIIPFTSRHDSVALVGWRADPDDALILIQESRGRGESLPLRLLLRPADGAIFCDEALEGREAVANASIVDGPGRIGLWPKPRRSGQMSRAPLGGASSHGQKTSDVKGKPWSSTTGVPLPAER